jgi:hypothetical protein
MWQRLLVVSALVCSAFGQDDALRDVQLGMQGWAQASKDPELLAQLMQDMQVCKTISSSWQF